MVKNMDLKNELNTILLTLNEIEVKGYTNVSLMLGSMQKIQELIKLCGVNTTEGE